MTCIAGLLARLAPEIEAQLKSTLAGLAGLFVQGYLPQVWVFSTGTERATPVVDAHGNARVTLGTVEPLDVLIASSHDTLSTALEVANGLRSRDCPISGQTDSQFYTGKGETAFKFSPKQTWCVISELCP